MTNATAVEDLVCGKGKAYFFSSAKCKEKFDLNPAQYLGKAAGTPKSGPSCCS